MWIDLILFVMFITALFLIYWFTYKNRNVKSLEGFPAGPPPANIFTSHFNKYFPATISYQLDSIRKWRESYGDIFGMRFGDRSAIIIHGSHHIKEAFSNNKFNGRISTKGTDSAIVAPATTEIMCPAAKIRGLIVSEGKPLSEQRKFVLKNLRDLGVGKQSFESMIHEEITALINTTLKINIEKPINLLTQLKLAVLNSLWHLMASERFSLDEPILKSFLNNLLQISQVTNEQVFGHFTLRPFELRQWVYNTFAKGQKEKSINSVTNFIQARIGNHTESIEEDARDFMDLYLREIEDAIDKDSSFYKEVGEENMLQTIIDILANGIEPTSNTLNWILYFLAKNPTIQKKVQEEVDQIIGHFHQSSVNDRLKMPYTEAVISETLRITTALSFPFGIPHCTTEDVTFHNFNIPKGTMVIGNFYELHLNEENFKEPNKFNPERFLNRSNLLQQQQQQQQFPMLAAFSLGKRNCPGETIARDIMFLFVTSLCQRFNISFFAGRKASQVETNNDEFNFSDINQKHLSNFKIIFQDRLEFLNRVQGEE